jgi:pseudaminic acid cytidylyltransferase
MMAVCIIPARGGSKRLPRKNFIAVDGLSILGRTIDVAQQANIFSKIIVSTEDDEGLEIAKRHGAIPYRRPLSLASDEAPVVAVCADVLNTFGITDVDFCCIYATASLIKPETIQASAIAFYSDTQAAALMGVSDFNFPPVQSLKIDENGWASMLMPEFKAVPSQHHPRTCVSNGTFYWARASIFLQELTFYSKRLKVFLVEEEEVCDLNFPKDLVDYIRKLNLRIV